jgi:hypothetical protein
MDSATAAAERKAERLKPMSASKLQQLSRALVRSGAWLERAGWSCQERGWWTHPTRGGICKETGGKWWAYPYSGDRLGPFKNARAAAARSNEKLRDAEPTTGASETGSKHED